MGHTQYVRKFPAISSHSILTMSKTKKQQKEKKMSQTTKKVFQFRVFTKLSKSHLFNQKKVFIAFPRTSHEPRRNKLECWSLSVASTLA
jgi:hypothetical protein